MDISYKVIRSSRRTIAIQLRSTGEIIVRSPRRLSQSEIHAFVQSKRGWIEKHLHDVKCGRDAPFGTDELEEYRKETEKLVTQRAAHFAPVTGVCYNKISVRVMRSRWGSCSGKGNLSFNCLLSLVPPNVLDYVVVHELCHLKQMNHSKAFWQEVEAILPDFRESRRWLREEGSRLIERID